MAHERVSTPRLEAALERIRPVIAALPGGREARTFASMHDEREWFEGRL